MSLTNQLPFLLMSGPFPKPIYTINGLSPSGNTGNMAILGTGGIAVSGSGSTITISGSGGGGGVPAPTANGQVPIGSAGGTFTTTTLTAGPGISIANGPGSVTISSTSAPSTQLAQVALLFQKFLPSFPSTFLIEAGVITTSVAFPITAIMPFTLCIPITPAANITLGAQNITFTQAGKYLIQMGFTIFSSGGNATEVYIQLIKNGTSVLFVSNVAMGTSFTTSDGSGSIFYIESFSVGDVIDFRIGQGASSGGFTTAGSGFYNWSIFVSQLPTSI